GTVSEVDLAQCLVDSIGPIARPKQIYMLSTMPKTRSGKIVRRLLSELVTDGRTTGDTTGLEDPEVLDKLKAEITGQS
ncbi:MAG: acetyl-coenzyme A synthetase, partial [Actinobacteria bacterium]|nr:acetyl-coenzyme A synthetase [Actinomycetota bacterium]